MQLSDNGIMEIVSYEGCCTQPYNDGTGVMTIGIGHTASDGEDPAKMPLTSSITVQQAFDMFLTDIKAYEDAVNKELTVAILQNQFDALVSICYNIGIYGEEHSTFIKDINAADSETDIRAAILLWDKPSMIISRRTKEANLYEYGIYSNNGTCLLTYTDGNGNELMNKAVNIKMAPYLSPQPVIVPVIKPPIITPPTETWAQWWSRVFKKK